MNPAYGGTYDLNEDMKSRFIQVELGWPTEKNELEILQRLYDEHATIPVAAVNLTLRRLRTLADLTRATNWVGYSLSTRDLQAATLSWAHSGDISRALKELEANYDSTNVAAFRAHVASTFPEVRNLEIVKLWRAR